MASMPTAHLLAQEGAIGAVAGPVTLDLSVASGGATREVTHITRVLTRTAQATRGAGAQSHKTIRTLVPQRPFLIFAGQQGSQTVLTHLFAAKLSAGYDAPAPERLRGRRDLRLEPLNTLPRLGLRLRYGNPASPARARSADLDRAATGPGALG